MSVRESKWATTPEEVARHHALRAKVLCEAADEIVAYCPDHGNRATARMSCHCAIADELRAMAASGRVTAGGLLAAMTRPEACAARSVSGLACTAPGGHEGAHEHQAADSDATTRWAGWSE